MVFGQNEIKNISQLLGVSCAKLTHLHISTYRYDRTGIIIMYANGKMVQLSSDNTGFEIKKLQV